MTAQLEAQGLVKRFRGRTVVDGLDITVQRGEIVGLLGPNGAGKTTAFRLILGLLAADAGQVRFGQKLDGLPLYRRARLGLGYLPQGSSVFHGLTVEGNLLAILESLRKPSPRDRAAALLERFGLTPLARQKARDLSGGERRRLELARALCTEPQILLCDEPFAGVDPIAAAEISRALAELASQNVGILLTDHSVHDAIPTCHRIFLIASGRIAACGTPAEILASDTARRLYLGDRFNGLLD